MKPRNLLLIALLSFSSLRVNAQDKYDFMIIEFDVTTDRLSVSENNKFTYEKVELPKGEKYHCNSVPLLSKVNEYQEKGWELISLDSELGGGASSGTEYFFAYLRKKK
jgi:hypothetical protein